MRNTCTYCSVACGILIYIKVIAPPARPPKWCISKAMPTIRPIADRLPQGRRAEGHGPFRDPADAAAHPPPRLGQVRGDHPKLLDKIARALKDDRDANLIQQNAAGVPVNRWTTTGFLAASATTNETAWLTYKAVMSMGIVGFDNQARV